MNQEQTLQEIMDIVLFLRDNMVMKQDLEHFAKKEDVMHFATRNDLHKFATREDLERFRDDILTHIDGFAVANQKFDVEIVALRAKADRLKSHIEQIAHHTKVQLV